MNHNQNPFSFETAYAELEVILSELNHGETPLEKSLELYEKANQLISLCSSKLTQAEQKIEMLIKNREGELQTAPYTPENEQVLKSSHDFPS
jgi:exodeoxyribonuclease VII small subunit